MRMFCNQLRLVRYIALITTLASVFLNLNAVRAENVNAANQAAVTDRDRVSGEAASPSAKWKPEIDGLTAHDATNPPPTNGIVFVGSSSIRLWPDLKGDFPGLPVIQRGFGGSEIADSVYYEGRIVFAYRPRVVVMFAGENDIANGKSPQAVANDFEAFRAKLHAELPGTRLVYIGIKPSPVRSAFFDEFKQTNALIAKACAEDRLCTFVDVWPLMLKEDGQPRRDLFRDDRLHMNATGYAIWRKAVTPHLLSGGNAGGSR